MSGRDSVSTSFGIVGGKADVCEVLAFETTLNSPKPNVTEQLNSGDILDLDLESTVAGVETVVARYNGSVAGGLSDQRIANCLSIGHLYKAEVIEARGALVRVAVRHTGRG